MATEINIQELTEDDIAAKDLPEKFNGNFGNLVQELISHIDNKENPHTVTAEQLGLTNAYVYKGSVATYQDLLAIQNPENGWVYDVQQEDKELEIAAGSNFAWNGTSWDNLGGKLSGLVKTVNGEEPDSNGNIQISTGDAFQKDMGYRENSETVKAGDIRFLYGKENAGKILMYTQNGVTAEEEPEFPYDENLNYVFPESGDLSYAPLGFPFPNPFPYIPDGCVPALGQESSVEMYPVFKYIQLRHPEMVITEEQWQQMATENNGHVPYYSSGNGSTTFRFPCLLHYFCATSDGQKLGKYEADGLPNIKGSGYDFIENKNNDVANMRAGTKGAITVNTASNVRASSFYASSANTFGTNFGNLGFDASLSNSIYGNSDSVRPKTVYGTWIIKAYGAVPTKEEMEAAGLVQSVSNVETKQRELEVKISELEKNIVILYPNGGTAEQPAEVTKNTRYIEENPFKGYYVTCEAQILQNGKWGCPCYVSQNGVSAKQLLPDDNIIIQTGTSYLSNNSNTTGNPFGNTEAQTTAQCRVIIHKLGKIGGEA